VSETEGAGGGVEARLTSDSSPPPGAELPADKSSQVSRPDTALNRVLHGARPANVPGVRRVLLAELLIVLAIFPLPSTIGAVTLLIARIQAGFPLPEFYDIASAVIRESWLWATLEASPQLYYLAVAALVWYLLARSGEGLAAIGLGGRRLRMDLALVLPAFIVMEYVPQTLGTDLERWLHLQGFYFTIVPQLHYTAALTAVQVVVGVGSGIVEEIVVLGFLVRRLEQLGLRTSWIVVIAVLVRVSYHLYYGWGAIPIALWALATVLCYLRIRRLLPFILCHIAWDAAIPFRAFYAPAYHVMFIAAVATGTVLALWWGWRPATTGVSTR
jgi:uncharacterized protein